MKGPSSGWEPVGDYRGGPLVAVKFSGVYPTGTDGNKFAEQMLEFLRGVLAETHATAVVVDLSELDYTRGDAIAGLALPFLPEKGKISPRAVVVAKGATSRALEPLFKANFTFGIAGMELVQTREEALEHIERAPRIPAAKTQEKRRAEEGQEQRRRFETLATRLQDPDQNVLLDRLVAATKDPSSRVREDVAVALRKSKDPRAFPALISLLGDKNRFVQRVAAAQLGFFGDRTAIEPLLEVFEKTPHLLVREEILKSLETLGHPTEALRQRIDVFDPIELVLNWVEDTPKMEPDSGIGTTLAANFVRQGAPASDRLAEIIQDLLRARSQRVSNAFQAMSVEVVLTPKLEAVLAEVASATWIDSRVREGAKVMLEKPKIVKDVIVQTLQAVAKNRKMLEEAQGRLYLAIFSRDYGFAVSMAKTISSELLEMLERAEEQLSSAGKSARVGDAESKSHAIASMDKAEQELARALKYVDDHFFSR